VDWSMQTLYRRLVVVAVVAVEWTGVCRLFTEDW
jgi:hypothetical protein